MSIERPERRFEISGGQINDLGEVGAAAWNARSSKQKGSTKGLLRAVVIAEGGDKGSRLKLAGKK